MNGMIEQQQTAGASRGGGSMTIASARQAQEVQAAMVIAKKFPRDQIAAENRIVQACKRKGLASASQYAYPRGGETVTGPSIRLAEAMAQNWGNLDFGIIELEQANGESQVMAYCWDLETNTRQTKVFAVKHERHTRNGTKKLTDPRDIYEMCANQGARRMRACILGVIPGDITDAAIEQCDKTLQGKDSGPLIDRIKKMVAAFADLGVTKEMIETRLTHPVDVCILPELTGLLKIYTSIKDGFTKREEWFEFAPTKKVETNKELTDKLAGGPAKTEEAKPRPSQQPAANEDISQPEVITPTTSDLIESLKATDTIKGCDELHKEFKQYCKDMDDEIHVSDLVNKRKEDIRSTRGPRSNGDTDAS